MRLAHLSLAALFMLAAAVQFNDPDPLYWIAVYAGGAAVALAMAAGRSGTLAPGIVIGASLAGMLQTWSGAWAYFTSGQPGSIAAAMAAERPWIEPAREFLGLSILAAVMLWYLALQHRRPHG